MSCLINRNAQGSIVGVNTPTGKKSQLFEAIHSNVFLGSPEASIKLMSGIYTDKMQTMFPEGSENTYDSGEPVLFYQSENKTVHSSLEKLLIEEKGSTVTMGFVNPKNGEFIPIGRFNTEGGKISSFLTSQIKEGTLSTKRTLGSDGITRMNGKGEFTDTKVAMAILFKNSAKFELADGNVKINKETGEISMGIPNEILLVETKEGDFTSVHVNEIPERADEFEDSPELKAVHAVLTGKVRPLSSKFAPTNTPMDAKSIAQALENFLENLGFSQTTLEAYRKRYNTLYGKDPDIQAMVDISNRVVAFANGQVTEDKLSEEVAHIAIEAYSDQNSIVGALAIAHLTPEYKEFSEYYRTKYAPFFQGVALEDQVRKEILGKILAKEFMTRFSPKQTTAENQNLLEKLRGYWESFINYIKGGIRPTHIRILNDLNKNIADNVIGNNMENFQYDLSSSNAFFYSAMSQEHQKLHQSLLRAKKVIEDTLSADGGINTDKYFLEKIQTDMNELNLVSSANTIVGIVDRKVSELERELNNIKPINGRPGVLSRTGENIASALKDSLIPLAESISVSLTDLIADSKVSDPVLKEKMRNTAETVSKSIQSITEKHRVLKERVDQDKDVVARMQFDEHYDTQNMTQEQYDKEFTKFQGTANTAIKDYGIFGKMMGLMTESRNPVLKLIAAKVQKMGLNVRMRFMSETNEIVGEIVSKGYQKHEKSIIKEDKDGKKTFFIWGPMDYARQHDEQKKKRVEILSRLADKKPEEIEKLLEKFTVDEILGSSEEKVLEFTNELKEWTDSTRVRQFKDSYYQKQADKYDTHKISQITQETIKSFGARAAEINRSHMTPTGQVDKSTMSPSEIEALNRIKKEREVAKSPIDQANEVKLGLKIVKLSELSEEEISKLTYKPTEDYKGDLVVVAEGFTIETLPEESRLALDMNNLTYAYMFETEKVEKQASQEFKDKVKSLEDQAAAGEITYEDVFNWVADNSTISLSDEYYANMDSTPTYEKSVETYITNIYDANERRAVENLLKEYQRLSKLRRYLMKQNKKIGSSLDVNVQAMDEKTRIKLLEIEGELVGVRNRIAIPDEYTEGNEMTSVVELNDDFYKMATEAGLNHEGGIYQFALKHMTHAKRVSTEEFSIQLEELFNGKMNSMDRYYEKFMDELDADGRVHDGMTREQVIRVAKDEFAKRNIAGYFKKFVPSTYGRMMESIKTGEVKVSDILENPENSGVPGARDISINPDYTWLSSINADDVLNPDYKKGGYHMQLNDNYIDKSWFDHYGISVEAFKQLKTDDISLLTATKNIEEFEYLKLYMKLREKSLEQYGDINRVNKWQRVQVSKTQFETYYNKGAVFNSLTNVKQSLKEFAQNRADEKAFGEEIEGVNLITEGSQVAVRSIPKYFQKKLPTPEEISENTLSTVLLDLRESIVYDERSQADRDVRALMHQITKQNFTESGSSLKGRVITKEGQVSNMYQKAREYVDHHLYGVQQSRPLFVSVNGKEIDLTKIITNIQSFTRFSNLGFNLFVDLTGATTGFLNNVVDRYAGDYYHKSSVNKANSQALKMLPDHLRELTKLDRNSKLGQILELLGVEDPTERIKESGAGRVGRFVKGSGYYFSRLSNMAISPKIALATLNDFRYYNGEFIAFETFVHRKSVLNDGPNNMKDIETEWKNLENESLFDHLDFSQKGITFNNRFKDKFENPKDEFARLITKVSAKAQKVIMNSDMVLNDVDRVAAQRDVLTNTLLMHRGWMLINLTKRFKDESYNVSTGRYEEGQYRTLLKLLSATLGTVRGKGELKEFLNNAERYQKKNLTRVALEAGILVALLVLGEAVLAGDDDDDTAAENLFQLIYLRTTSEFNSSTALGIMGSIAEAGSSPIPALNTYKMFNLFVTVPEMFQENAQGENKFLKKVRKNSFLRRYDQYSDLQTQIEAYRYYNDPTLLNLGSVGKKKDEEQPTNENAVNSIRIN